MGVHGLCEEHGPRVLLSQYRSLSNHTAVGVRNTAWPGWETETRALGPHSQKRPEDHSEAGKNKLSSPNFGGPLPQER